MPRFILVPVALVGLVSAGAFASAKQDGTSATGRISSLDAGSITVGSGGSSLTCSIGAGSPRTSGFAVGDPVGMYCLSGALQALVHR